MVPKLVADFAPAAAPDCEGDSAGGCGGELCPQLAALDNSKEGTDARTPIRANPEMLWPREAAELRSAWPLRLRSGQARAGPPPPPRHAPATSSRINIEP